MSLVVLAALATRRWRRDGGQRAAASATATRREHDEIARTATSRRKMAGGGRLRLTLVLSAALVSRSIAPPPTKLNVRFATADDFKAIASLRTSIFSSHLTSLYSKIEQDRRLLRHRVDEEAVLDWVRRDSETALHPSCTARMGTDHLAVVDPTTLNVHGVRGLSVVDASVMPRITNGNIYAPVMMVAERSADLIMGNTPLSPSRVPFHHHGQEDKSP